MASMSADRPKPGCRTWWAWVLANALGWAVGLTAGGGVAGVLIPEPNPACPICGEWNWLLALMGGLLGLLVSGATVGIGQWLVLRPHIRRAGWWIPAIFGSWAMGEFVSILIGISIRSWKELMVAVAASATIIGIGQALVLKHSIFSGVGWWIPASVAGWVVGWIAGGVTWSIFLLATPEKLEITLPVFGGLLGMTVGAGYGMITGAVLNWLLQYAPHPSPPDPLSPLPMGEGRGAGGEGRGRRRPWGLWGRPRSASSGPSWRP